MPLSELREWARQRQREQSRRLSSTISDASAAGGKVAVRMNGHKTLLSIKIAPALQKPDHRAKLEGHIIEAVNAATIEIETRLRDEFGIVDKMPRLMPPEFYED